MKKSDPFYMAGTEKTGQYVVVAVSSRGRVGIRRLDEKTARIRLEPSKNPKGVSDWFQSETTQLWKRPGQNGENRFSLVVGDKTSEQSAVKRAMLAIGLGDTDPVKVSAGPKAPKWVKDYINKHQEAIAA